MTTGAPGYLARISAMPAAVMLSASEQPASMLGISTVLDGFRILDVSAMKCTPHCTITSASTFVASIDS